MHLVVATGRPARWLDCLEPLHPIAPTVIVSNGAAQIELASRAVIRRTALDESLIRELGTTLHQAFPGVLLAIEEGEAFGCEPGWLELTNDSMVPMDLPRSALGVPWADLVETVRPAVKVLALALGRSAEEFAAHASDVIGDRAVVTHSAVADDRALLEISAPGVSKASALQDVCRDRGIALADVAAFGDMPNDLDMLTLVGHGYAMGNAHPDLLARFPVVPPHTAGGVGQTLRTLMGQA